MANKGICYICCEDGADTDDHVIPQGFFTPPLPTVLLTLPAHFSCHHRLPEEYVRNLFSGLGQATSPTAALL